MKKELTEIEKKRAQDKMVMWLMVACPIFLVVVVFLKTQHPQIWETVSAVGLVLTLLCAYFLPSSIAKGAKHPQTTAIFLLNLLLGWTFLGWVVALIWAAYKQKTV
jgi:Superinfection immunity protein